MSRPRISLSDQSHIADGVPALEYLKELRTSINVQFRSEFQNDLGLDLLTPDEERKVESFYHDRIDEVCKFLAKQTGSSSEKSASKIPKSQGLPCTVAPLAHSFLTRFYARNSVMSTDPKHLMLTCVLLASKCCHMHLTMDQFAGRIPNTDHDLLLCLETRLLSALFFNVCPTSPLEFFIGILLDLAQNHDNVNINTSNIQNKLSLVYKKCSDGLKEDVEMKDSLDEDRVPTNSNIGGSYQTQNHISKDDNNTFLDKRQILLEGILLIHEMARSDLPLIYNPVTLARIAYLIVTQSSLQSSVTTEDVRLVQQILDSSKISISADEMRALDRRLVQIRKNSKQ